jgi:hypothetical protein
MCSGSLLRPAEGAFDPAIPDACTVAYYEVISNTIPAIIIAMVIVYRSNAAHLSC